jgi:hypothetical protein
LKFEDFKELLVQSLEIAADNAESALGKQIAREYKIQLYGPGHSGDILDVDEAATLLYINESSFYRIIDIAVKQISPRFSTVFVRVSGHKPVPFEKTWDTPKGHGPFKQIMALIQVLDT